MRTIIGVQYSYSHHTINNLPNHLSVDYQVLIINPKLTFLLRDIANLLPCVLGAHMCSQILSVFSRSLGQLEVDMIAIFDTTGING
jgi:hypothetical protein